MKKVYVGLLIVLILLSAGLFYININRPIKVALIGNFQEERYSFATSSIIAGRIAENDINSKLGIRGKNTELVIREDDFQNPEATIEFLLSRKIEAIITTAASQDLLKLKPLLDKNKIVCVAVGSTSDSLSGLDDYIFRILPDDEKEIKTLVEYLDDAKLPKDIVLIYDKSNMEYKHSIEKSIQDAGAKIVFEEGWQNESLNYSPSNTEIMKDKPILILSSARNTAFIVQKLKQQGGSNNIFGMSWSGDDYLLSYGGRAVENFILITPVDFSENESSDLSVKLSDYRKKNGLIPNGVYNAYNIIKKAYEDRQEQHITLKDALDKVGSFDRYGDSKGNEYILKIKDGQYTKLGGRSYENTQN